MHTFQVDTIMQLKLLYPRLIPSVALMTSGAGDMSTPLEPAGQAQKQASPASRELSQSEGLREAAEAVGSSGRPAGGDSRPGDGDSGHIKLGPQSSLAFSAQLCHSARGRAAFSSPVIRHRGRCCKGEQNVGASNLSWDCTYNQDHQYS